MGLKEQRSALRGAVYRSDGPAVVSLLGGGAVPGNALQLAGDGLLAAVAQRVEGARELAVRLAAALRQRGWTGDDELADQLDALLGTGATPMLRPLAVDLDQLAGILEGDPLQGGGRIDLTTGDIWPQPAIDYARETGDEEEEDDDDPGRWLQVDGEGSRGGRRDLELFVATVDDPGRADRLAIAIDGKGAFRRFKDVLARWPDELDRWQALSEDRQRGRARSWLAGAGYRVSPGSRRKPHP
jgi:hypothetical protein